MAVGRIEQFPAQLRIPFKKTFIRVGRCALNGIVIRVECLKDYSAGIFLPAGTAGDLGKHLECSLCCSEIREVQGKVSTEHPHERDARKVMTFDNHLGPREDIDLLFPETVQYSLEIFPSACGVAIEPLDARVGEYRGQLFFYFLSPNTTEKEFLA